MPFPAVSMTCAEVYGVINRGETRRIQCHQGVTGSVVRIRQLEAVPMILSLCEVEVYGTHRKDTPLSWATLKISQCIHHCS